MSDDDSHPPPRPPPVRPTAAWLAEQRAKRLAYENQRRRYMQAWYRGSESPDEEAEANAAVPGQAPGGRGRRPSRGPIHDPRQGKLDV